MTDISINTTGWTLDDTIPEGRYDACLMNVEQAVSRAGSDMLVWDFVIVKGPYAGREFRTWTVLNESQAWKLDEVLRATGLGAVGEKITLKYEQYVNRRVILELVDDEYNGRLRSTIKRVLPPEEGPGTKWEGGVPKFEDDGPSIGRVPNDDDNGPF